MDEIESAYEDACMHFGLIDQFSQLLLDKLCKWSNKEIFEPLGGSLSVETPLKESVNAGAVVDLIFPLNTQIIIHMGMVQEIYRDSFGFPAYSEKLAKETENFKDKNWKMFKNAYFKFESGVPDIPLEEISTFSKQYSSTWLRETEKLFHKEMIDKDQLDILKRIIPVRFQMFELMLTWVFFHELSHLVQCHYKFKECKRDNFEFFEIESTGENSDLKGQSREILADLEGIDLTINYMQCESFCNPNTLYLLLCSITCMFNRFYNGKYKEDFDEIKGTHPHPIVRDEFLHKYFCYHMAEVTPYVWKPEIRNSILLGYGYLTVRSALAASLFWSIRYLGFNGHGYPSYMELQMKTNSENGKKYVNELSLFVEEQLEFITKNHLYPNTKLNKLFSNGYFRKQIHKSIK